MKLQKWKANKKENETIIKTIKNYIKYCQDNWKLQQVRTAYKNNQYEFIRDMARARLYTYNNVSVKRDLTDVEVELYRYFAYVVDEGKLYNIYTEKYGIKEE